MIWTWSWTRRWSQPSIIIWRHLGRLRLTTALLPHHSNSNRNSTSYQDNHYEVLNEDAEFDLDLEEEEGEDHIGGDDKFDDDDLDRHLVLDYGFSRSLPVSWSPPDPALGLGLGGVGALIPELLEEENSGFIALDDALSFIAAERERWAASRETAGHGLVGDDRREIGQYILFIHSSIPSQLCI
jgi:hypothetical protein